MSLKPFRNPNPFADDISFFMDEVAEAGGIAVISTGGSGAAMDQAESLATYSASPSGKVAVGLLVTPMVNKDLTQTHLNRYNGEVQKGGKVLVNRDGVWETNMVLGTPAAGGTAYLGPSGYIQVTAVNAANNPTVGTFLSSKDEDGYAKVRVKL
jgi:hypothetical protein